MSQRVDKKRQANSQRQFGLERWFYVKDLADKTNSLNDPVVIRALESIKRFAHKQHIVERHVERVEKKLKPKLTVDKRHPNPFLPNPLTGDLDGEIKIGNARPTGFSFGLDRDEIGEHILIAGRAGAGKTTLLYIILEQLLDYGTPFWAFDFKQDYRHLTKSHEVLVFDSENFRFNPLRPPPGVSPKAWMQIFTNIFCQSYYLLVASKGIVLGEIKRLYDDYDVFSGSNTYPCMFDLHESLMNYKPQGRSFRKVEWLESTRNRMDECLLSFDNMFDCDQGFKIEDLLENNVVFEAEGLLTNNQRFFINIILRYVFQYKISNNQRSKLKHVFLFDEAKAVYNKKEEFSKDLGDSEIAQFTSRIRAFGEGLVVADQMPTQLADSIKANVYTVICMSQSGGPNVSAMSQAMGLTREQTQACRNLRADKKKQVFEAIVKLNGKWQTPFLIKVKPYELVQDVSDTDLRELMASHLKALNQSVTSRTDYSAIMEAKRKASQEKQAEERKAREEEARQKEAIEGNRLINILTNIRDYPFVDQKTRIGQLDLGSSSSTSNKYFQELVARGFVTVHKIGLGRGRSTLVLYEITEKGMDFAKMDKAYIPGKGEFKHKFWQHTIKEFYTSLGYNAEIEKRYGIKNVDVGVEINGKRTAIEVELTDKHLIENIQRDYEAGCELIIIATSSQAKIKSYKKKIGMYSKDFLDMVEFRVLTDFLP